MKLTCFFDGSCGPKNPGGKAAFGFVIKHNGATIKTGRGVIGEGPGMTNNVAECVAATRLLEAILADFPAATEIFVHGDSNIVIRRLSGKGGKSPKGHYAKWLPDAHAAASRLRAKAWLYFMWVPRAQNAEADELADFGNGFEYRPTRHNVDEDFKRRMERES